MIQCLRITLVVENVPKTFLQEIVRKEANNLRLEGTAQALDDVTIKIVVCGNRNDVEVFVDALHEQTVNYLQAPLEIEPFIKQKDYRGVFRVIE